ncbi:outer membrane protein assembly factor BamE [Telmatospirillum sp.]|uniref:outer membrane protein assembly factor BamE n=1 Tax=Telmatospirillum sp. TaxID=2079197 RepID=UPI00284EF5BA|nr:outer membrane protein assembly factor BamE [Telmatospirillum sp.]MDR3440836.1 outer membrane protein assembly factor BamE [Telmatospirillum sp.]
MHSRFVRFLSLVALLGAMTACDPVVDLRGNLPSQERLAEIKPGRFTKQDVTALLGTPASTAVFGDERWYYISSKIETIAFFKPEELERQVIIIDFDRTGTVSDIKKLTLENGKDVQMVARETPSAGRDLNVLEQLLGNIGKFNSKAKDDASGPGGGS